MRAELRGLTRCDTPKLRWRDLWGRAESRRDPVREGPELVPVHSGKAGLSHVFSYLRAIGVLKDQNSKILVPPWLGYWVYNVIQQHGFPVLHPDRAVRVALVYHQYGFPQDMEAITAYAGENQIVLVEDCAHCLNGLHPGRPLGSYGVAAIFSYSKFVPSLIGGSVRSADEALREHVRGLEQNGSRALGWLSFGVKAALEHAPTTNSGTGLASRINELAYAGYPNSHRLSMADRLSSRARLDNEMLSRRRNYALYRSLLTGLDEVQRLEPDICPYVLPLMGRQPEDLRRIVAALREDGIDTGIYSFDTNRNMLCPRYQPCVWLPVHSGITETRIERIATIVRRNS